MSAWEIERNRTNVVCPDCAFSFDAIHQDGDGGYTCPLCESAPAPAEGRQVLALDAIRDVLGIDYDEDSAMWYLPAEPAPIECATLDDALRAYAKMAAPASGEPSGADAAVREALDAIKKAHAAVDDLCNGRRWTMSVPARPDADPDLVIGDALTKAERVIRSLAGPTAPGAPEEGAGT